MEFRLKSNYVPAGDQPGAIAALNKSIEAGNLRQTLLGVTGSGKTFTMANIIARQQRPALIVSHNKTLAAQLYSEFKNFFPENAVEYFVSYYDYYQRKTCFRGMLRYNKDKKFNIPFGRYKTINYTELLNKDYETLLNRTEIYNEKFEVIFDKYNDERNFMFLDPPYDSEFTDYGYCVFDKEEQRKLANLFKTTKIKCLMVIGKTKFIEELYEGYIVEEYDKKYKFKLYNNRIGDEINNKHLIIKNY